MKELVRPLRTLISSRRLRPIGYRLINFWRQSGNQSQAFAYVNDEGEGYTLLTTYVDIAGKLES